MAAVNYLKTPPLVRTRERLHFADYIQDVLNDKKNTNKDDLLEKIKEYYDGYSFDGKTRVYNPFSILNFFYYKEFEK